MSRLERNFIYWYNNSEMNAPMAVSVIGGYIVKKRFRKAKTA